MESCGIELFVDARIQLELLIVDDRVFKVPDEVDRPKRYQVKVMLELCSGSE